MADHKLRRLLALKKLTAGARRRRSAARRSPAKRSPAKMEHAVGSRRQVWEGHAHHTKGGLKKSDLVMNKWGRIVSKRKMAMGRKLFREYKNVLKANRAKAFK
jgi:hypothetical protein